MDASKCIDALPSVVKELVNMLFDDDYGEL